MADGGRRRRIVRPQNVFFGDIDEDRLVAPLALPPLPPLPDPELVILHDGTFHHLHEDGSGPAPNSMTLCGLTFAVVPCGTVVDVEADWRRNHEAELRDVRGKYLGSLDRQFVDAEGTPQRTPRNEALAHGALDKLVQHGGEDRRAVVTALDPSLFLFDERFDLLTPRDFFGRWRRGFHPDVVAAVVDRTTPWGAAELSKYLAGQADKSNPRSLSVVRHRLHSRLQPPVLTMAGADLVPDPVDGASRATFLADWLAAIEQDLRRQFIEELLP